jgi:hypothetical protein
MCCRPFRTWYVAQNREMRARRGPGYAASGWKGERRYATIDVVRASRYVTSEGVNELAYA